MMNVLPNITHLRNVDCSRLKFTDGRASFRPVVYDNENVFVRFPKSPVVGVDEFRDDKGGCKHYLCIDVKEHAELFDGLSSWLGNLASQIHPITKENFGNVILKMKVPTPHDKTSCPGIFDEESRPIELQDVKPGCMVETIAHFGNVWTMRGTTGLTMSAAQIKMYRRRASCLITVVEDEDDDVSAPPWNADSQCMIAG